MRVAWTIKATRDLQSIRAFIAQDNPRAAKRTARRILDATTQLIDFPALGRPGQLPNTRELIVPGTPYFLPYRVEDNIVQVLGVIHAARIWPAD